MKSDLATHEARNLVNYLIWILIAALVGATVNYVLLVREKNKYFASEEFLEKKRSVEQLAFDFSEIAEHLKEIADSSDFELGQSNTGRYSHAASFENVSSWNQRRDRHVSHHVAKNVHRCSLQVVRNASIEPYQYLSKYFGIPANEESLSRIEGIYERLSRMSDALDNLENRANQVRNSVNPPEFIEKLFRKEFDRKLGVEIPKIEFPTWTYIFEHVSPGGNKAHRTSINIDVYTLEEFIEYLAERVSYKKSAVAQRALMTSKLREFVKQRDGYACNHCGLSIEDEPNLLLEIDHIIPISRGGLTVLENLQALCWKCNRSKSNKTNF